MNFLCRCRNIENVEPTFMLALCSRVVVLLGSPVSLKDCKKDELYDCLGGGGTIARHGHSRGDTPVKALE